MIEAPRGQQEPGPAKPKRQPRPPYPARAVATDPRRTGIWVGIGVGLVALVVLGVVLALTWGRIEVLLGLPGAAEHDIEGSITITDPTGYSGDSDCAGDGAYTDIAEGTSVVVNDVEGTMLSTGALSAGVEDVDEGDVEECTFFFTLKDVPTDHMFYEVVVGHRRYPDISKAALMPEGWTVDLIAAPAPVQRGTEPLVEGRPRQLP